MSFLKEITLPLRHRIVRVIAPKVYQEYESLSTQPTQVARFTIQFVRALVGCEPVIGVEIGVLTGENARSILETLNVETLYLIDPYEPYLENDKVWGTTNFYEAAKSNVARWSSKVHFIQKSSMQAAESIPNNLDFVYIDGNHDYPYVKSDIETYYPKVRGGGVIGGHDFTELFPGVIRAVIEYAVSHQLKLHVREPEWWIRVPS